jgi:AcrR family transcriptional regulator
MKLQLRLTSGAFLKDPQTTGLGQKIIAEGIRMIDEMGFEAFTFRKLSQAIDSTEASIYRYFENKHRLLIYLIGWYWLWIEYQIHVETQNIEGPKKRLRVILKIITRRKEKDANFPDIDEIALQRIVIAESDKTWLVREVDEMNREGLFMGYKKLCALVKDLILEINPKYPYPSALASTIMEAANHQLYFAQHLPSLTELRDADNRFERNYEFLEDLVFHAIESKR